MKILHVFDVYGIPHARALPGGENGSVASVVYYLARSMAAKGHDVTILERDLGELPKEEYIDGIRYYRMRADGLPKHPYKLIHSPKGVFQLLEDGFKIARKINSFLKSENFDVVHHHFPMASSVLISLNRKLRKKSIYTAHVGEEKMRFGLGSSAPAALRFFSPDVYLMKRIEKSVVLNQPLKDMLVEKGIEESKIEVIPNGVDVKEFNSPEKDDNNKNEGEVKLLFVGKIIPRKGVEVLLKAVKLLVEQGVNNFSLVLAGDTELDPEFYKRMVEYSSQNGLEDFVRFKGMVSYEELRSLYFSCDVFVFPSFEEGDPIALKEALASGKPLIGSNVSGIPMQLKDGWNGFLVEAGDERHLAEKIEYLIENDGERETMGERSRRLAKDEFDWVKITEKYLEVYKG